MAELDDYLTNLRNTGATNYSLQPGVSAKPRQGIKMDPTDSAHLTTHQTPEAYVPSGDQRLPYADGTKDND